MFLLQRWYAPHLTSTCVYGGKGGIQDIQRYQESESSIAVVRLYCHTCS